MDNPFLLRSDDRLSHWKEFRNSLSEQNFDEQLLMVARYWAESPLLKRAYDIEFPEDIPGPWEMMIANNWCRESTAIGMEFTLRLGGFPQSLELVLVRDYDISEQVLCLEIDNKLWLNYCVGQVVPIPNSGHDIIGRFNYNGRSYCHSSEGK